ncbi:MAG: serine hydrolase domain-containing protein [Pseudomonadota bacterium]
MRRPMNVFVLLVLCSGATDSLRAGTQLISLKKPILRQLAEGDSHSYQIRIEADSFVYAELQQIDFDGKVTIYSPAGAIVGVFDHSARGADPVQFDTKESGTYKFVVEGFRGQFGDYALDLENIEPTASEPEQRLNQLLTSFAGDDNPGAVVAVIQDGVVTHAEAVGMASLVYGVPFTRMTPSNIGSVSKQFTAWAITKLAADGLIELDDDVRQYFPTLPDFGQVVTVRHLLNHTNGYREFLNMLYMSGRRTGEGDYIGRDEVLNLLENQAELQSAPGSQYNYNNSAYTLAALLVERVTKQPFHLWLKSNLFEPLGMRNTRLRSHTGEIIPNAAEGYLAAREAPFRLATDLGGGGEAMMGPGGIYSTVDDLALWMGNFTSGTVGSRQQITEMFTANVAEPGNNLFYGLGVDISNYRGLELISHDGADTAHRAELWYFPTLNAGIVGMSNNGRFDSYKVLSAVADVFFAEHLREDVPAAVLGDPGKSPIEFNPDSYLQLAGQYEWVGYPGVMTFIEVNDSGIYVSRPGGEPQPATPKSASVIQVSSDSQFRFSFTADGVVETLTIEDGSSIVARKLDPWLPETSEYSALVGDYYAEELGTVYKVIFEDGQLLARHHRIGDMVLTPKVVDTFNANDALSEVRFVRDDNGKVTGFMGSNIRTLNIWFRKQSQDN